VNLDGILPPIATPFSGDDVDLKGLRANVDRWMRTGLRGLVVLGSNGEAPLVSEDEAVRIVGTAREGVPPDCLLIAGTGRQSTRGTIAATRAAAAAGADGVLVLTPSFYKTQMSGDALDRHYRAVADASPVPVVLYNFPAVTGVTLPMHSVQKLAEHPNIAGIKESSGDVGATGEYVATTRGDFRVVVGAAQSLYASLLVGADGGVVALANVIPELCVRLHALTRNGQHEEALALQRAILPLSRAVTATYGIAGLKAAMEIAGYVGGPPRAPLLPLPDAARPVLTALFEQLMARA
jgi:4-hydroxy-2-oxoglutarate aldolase